MISITCKNLHIDHLECLEYLKWVGYFDLDPFDQEKIRKYKEVVGFSSAKCLENR